MTAIPPTIIRLEPILAALTRKKSDILEDFTKKHKGENEAENYAAMLNKLSDNNQIQNGIKTFEDFIDLKPNKHSIDFMKKNSGIDRHSPETIDFLSSYTYLLKQNLNADTMKLFEDLILVLASKNQDNRMDLDLLIKLKNSKPSKIELEIYAKISDLLIKNNQGIVALTQVFKDDLIPAKLNNELLKLYLNRVEESRCKDWHTVFNLTKSFSYAKGFNEKQISIFKELLDYTENNMSQTDMKDKVTNLKFCIKSAKHITDKQFEKFKEVYPPTKDKEDSFENFTILVSKSPSDKTFNFIVDLIQKEEKNIVNLLYFIDGKPSDSLIDLCNKLFTKYREKDFDTSDLTEKLRITSIKNEESIDLLSKCLDKLGDHFHPSKVEVLLSSINGISNDINKIKALENGLNTISYFGFLPFVVGMGNLNRLNLCDEDFSKIIEAYTNGLIEGAILEPHTFFDRLYSNLKA